VPPSNWHFTLRFLGEVEPGSAEQISGAMTRTALPPAFDAALGGLGAFPSPYRARTLWLGLSRGAAQFSRLSGAVDLALASAGVAAADTRPFSPHLTIARLDRPADLTRLIAGHGASPIPFSVDALLLYRSDLGGGPPRYTELGRFPLRA
jgi:RNA 2',3'-cyclic 3'-phosphodiesterase